MIVGECLPLGQSGRYKDALYLATILQIKKLILIPPQEEPDKDTGSLLDWVQVSHRVPVLEI